MITVCLADNFPVVHYGIKSYFKDHSEINVISNVGSFYMVPDALRNRDINVLLMDLEIEGLKSLNELKILLKNFPKTKILLFSNLNEDVYAANAIKIGVSGFVSKNSKLEILSNAIIRTYQGMKVIGPDVRKQLQLLPSSAKDETLFKKLSNREIEVLKYLCEGKKNSQISKILNLNEKTISTYKLRLFQKLSVNNLVELINKAKSLELR